MATKLNLVQVVVASGFLFFLSTAQAATRYVDGKDGNDGSSCLNAASPCLTIGRALDVAQSGDVIDIADAVYTEVLAINQTLTLQGESRTGTIIQAAAARGQASDRTISVDDDVALQLSDLTIRHGNTGLRGGGLRGIGGDLLIERVTFADNDAEGGGGGLDSGENVVVMNDVLFRENGSRVGGGAHLGVNFNLTDVTLANVIFENNTAQVTGGGLDLFNAQSQLNDVAFIGNVSNGNGGGLSYVGSNSVDSSLALTNAGFIGNEATDFGGGMYTQTDDTPFTIINALFSGNLANSGGGLTNQAGLDEGDRILINVTITGNSALGDGGDGGGIDSPSGMILRNTIIWNNQDETGIGTPEANLRDRFRNAVVEVSNSLLQGYGPNEWPGSNNLDGTDPSNAPQFVTQVSPVGAPSQQGNLRLREQSPVIDAGDNAFVNGVNVDLDGLSRINGGTVDLGPYEHGNSSIFQDRFEN